MNISDLQNILPPPWIKYPAIGLGSMAWRMGYGEEYWYLWQNWYGNLNLESQKSFQLQYPEPDKWFGFYQRSLENFKIHPTSDTRFLGDSRTLNEALLSFLGANAKSGGYQPNGNALDRLKAAHPDDWASLELDIGKILDKTIQLEVNWDKYPWPDEAALFVEERLSKIFPWLSSPALKSLSSYFTYQWK